MFISLVPSGLLVAAYRAFVLHAGSFVAAHRWGFSSLPLIDLYPLSYKVDSYPLDHHGSPLCLPLA